MSFVTAESVMLSCRSSWAKCICVHFSRFFFATQNAWLKCFF